MADLYGELLSRALNRGAPPGHSAAYITPQEGGILRAFGGGVPPGGGQYMANGIPSFQEFGGTDPGIADPTGPTGGYGSAGHELGTSSAWNSPAERGMAAAVAAAQQAQREAGTEGLAHHSISEMARQMEAARMAEARARQAAVDREVTTQALPAVSPAVSPVVQAGVEIADLYRAEASPSAPSITQQQTAAERAEEAEYGYGVGEEPPGTFIGNTPPAWGNIPEHARNVSEGYRNNPDNFDDYGDLTETGVQNAQNNLSDNGLGWQSPGAMGARVGMSFADLAALNSLSRDGGYSVNATNPDQHDLRVSFLNARYNPNAANVAFGAGGLLSPSFMTGINFLNRRSPYAQYEGYETPGLGNILGQGARAIGLGGVVDAFGRIGDEFGNVVDEFGNIISGVTEPFTDAIGNLGTRIGTDIGDALTPVGAFLGGAPPAVGGPSVPQNGGNREVYVPPQLAPVTEPFVPDDAERQFAEIPPEILARILANEAEGVRRRGLV